MSLSDLNDPIITFRPKHWIGIASGPSGPSGEQTVA